MLHTDLHLFARVAIGCGVGIDFPDIDGIVGPIDVDPTEGSGGAP